MVDIRELDFTIHPKEVDGKPILDADFGYILDLLFDAVPTKTNKNFALYNNILIDIRNARKVNKITVDITVPDLKEVKELLLAGAVSNPTINRRVAFLTDIIDGLIADKPTEESTVPEITAN